MDSTTFSNYDGLHLAQLPEQQQTGHGSPEWLCRTSQYHGGETVQQLIRVWIWGITVLSCCQAELWEPFTHSTEHTSATQHRGTAPTFTPWLQGLSLEILCSPHWLPCENDSLGCYM